MSKPTKRRKLIKLRQETDRFIKSIRGIARHGWTAAFNASQKLLEEDERFAAIFNSLDQTLSSINISATEALALADREIEKEDEAIEKIRIDKEIEKARIRKKKEYSQKYNAALENTPKKYEQKKKYMRERGTKLRAEGKG